MSSLAADSPGTPLRAAVLHYFQWLASHEEKTAAASTTAQSTAGADNENNAPPKRGQKVVAALLEEFPELNKFKAPALPQPELKARFETFPLQLSRNTFLTQRIVFLESCLRSPLAPLGVANAELKQPPKTTPRTNGQKRKDPPAGANNESPSKQPKTSPPSAQGVALVSENSTSMVARSPQVSKAAASVPPNRLKKDEEGFSWQERYEQLVHYQKGYGHCRVTEKNYKEVPGLGNWVVRQRANYRQGKLLLSQIDKLFKIDFKWIVKDQPNIPWEERYEELKAFQREHGHCRVTRHNQNKKLGEWVHNQRCDYRLKKKCLMETDRFAKLQAIGFEFTVDLGHKTWDERFQQLVEFRRKHGHIDVPVPKQKGSVRRKKNGEETDGGKYVPRSENDDETRFQTWVRQQKIFYRKYRSGDCTALTHNRFKKLDEIGFNKYTEPVMARGSHRRDDDTWNMRLEQLRQYKEQFGDCNVNKNSVGQYKQLGDWVARQRQFHRLVLAGKQSSLTPERKQALDDLGFQWTLRPWMLKENRAKMKKGDEMEDDDEDTD